MDKFGYRSQSVINHLLLDSGGLKYSAHHIFHSEVSLLPSRSPSKSICELFDHISCPPTAVVLRASSSSRRAAEQRTSRFPHCSACWSRYLCHILYFSMALRTCEWLLLLVPFAEMLMFLFFFYWITSKVSLLSTTERFNNDAVEVEIHTY